MRQSQSGSALALQDFGKQPARLTGREFDILRLLAHGQSVGRIARSMGISPKTVANHQSAIKFKLGAQTRPSASCAKPKKWGSIRSDLDWRACARIGE
jgi:DNA-binding CsgD family transcriptional regulator